MISGQYHYYLQNLVQKLKQCIDDMPSLRNVIPIDMLQNNLAAQNSTLAAMQLLQANAGQLKNYADVLHVTATRVRVSFESDRAEQRNIARKQELIVEMQEAYEEARQEFEQLVDQISAEREVPPSHLGQHLVILSPNQQQSEFVYDSFEAAKEVAHSNFERWFEPIPAQCANYVESCYPHLLDVNHEQFSTGYAPIRQRFMQKISELNEKISTISRQQLAKHIQPIDEQLPMSAHTVSLPPHHTISLEDFQWQKYIVISEAIKTKMVLFSHKKYAYYIGDVVRQARLKMMSSLTTYDDGLRQHVANFQYRSYPRELLAVVMERIEQQLQALENAKEFFKSDQYQRELNEQGEETRSAQLTEASMYAQFLHAMLTESYDYQTVVHPGQTLDDVLSECHDATLLSLTTGTYYIRRQHVMRHQCIIRAHNQAKVTLYFENEGAIHAHQQGCLVLQNIDVRCSVLPVPAIVANGLLASIENCTFETEHQQVGMLVGAETECFVTATKFQGFSTAIDCRSNKMMVAEDCTFIGQQSSAITMFGDADYKILYCQFLSNVRGLHLSGRSHGILERNIWKENTESSIVMTNYAKAEVEYNEFTHNAIGIVTQDQAMIHIHSNQFAHQQSAAVVFQGSTHGNFEHNTISQEYIGIAVCNHAFPAIANNKISDCERGIVYTDYARGYLSNNKISQCGAEAVAVEGKASPVISHNSFSEQPVAIVATDYSDVGISFNNLQHITEAAIHLRGMAQAQIDNNEVQHFKIAVQVSGNSIAYIDRNQWTGNDTADQIAVLFEHTSQGSVIANQCKQVEQVLRIIDQADVRIADNASSLCGTWLTVAGNAYVIARQNSVALCRGTAIWLTEKATVVAQQNDLRNNEIGIHATGAATFLLQKNTAVMNRQAGIILAGFCNGVAEHNLVMESEHGIVLTDQIFVQLNGNECMNGTIGIHVERLVNGEIKYNRCTKNETGMLMNGMRKVRVTSNTFVANTVGLIVAQFASPYLLSNTCSNNVQYGILFKGDASGEVEENNIQHNGIGIGLTIRSYPTIKSNDIRHNRHGVIASDDSELKFTLNRVDFNREHGVLGENRAKCYVDNNRFQQHEAMAIKVSGECIGHMTNNVIMRSGVGIHYADQSYGTIKSNQITNSRKTAIEVIEMAKPQIESNDCNNNYYGITVRGQAQVIATRNKCEENEIAGIFVTNRGYLDASHNQLSRNLGDGLLANEQSKIFLRQNTVEHNDTNGIHIRASAAGKIRANHLFKNKQMGVKVEPTTAVFFERQKYRNGMLGFFSVNEWSNRKNIKKSRDNAKLVAKKL